MPGLVAAYSFDEDGGTTVVDRSGHGNDGTLINDPSRIADGRSGGALSFNGVDQRVNVPDSPSLDLGKGMTIEAWVRPSDVDGYHAAVFKEDRTQQQEGYALYASNGNGKPTGEVATGQRYTTLAGSEPITAGTWTHIAATYDGDTLRVFRDGVEVGSKALSGTLNATSDPLCIGGNSVWGEWFKGAIDEVRVWNVARTASQIQSDSTTAID